MNILMNKKPVVTNIVEALSFTKDFVEIPINLQKRQRRRKRTHQTQRYYVFL
jgi:hypothetical protein